MTSILKQGAISMNNVEMSAIYGKYLRVFPKEEKRLALLKQCLDDSVDVRFRSEMRGHLTAGAIIMSADNSRILLVHHKALNIWIAPGGHYDLTDQSLRRTAEREAIEETQARKLRLDKWHKGAMIPFDIDIHRIPMNLKKNEGEHYHFDCRYVFRVGDNNFTPQVEEVLGIAWIYVSDVAPSSSLYSTIEKALERLEPE